MDKWTEKRNVKAHRKSNFVRNAIDLQLENAKLNARRITASTITTISRKSKQDSG